MTENDPPASSAAPNPGSGNDPAVADALKRYWRTNVTIMAVLLTIWAIVGLGCGILFADVLNQYKLGGYPLGFWFAQQGSIMVFVLIILTYCILLDRLDKRHHSELEQIQRTSGSTSGGGGAA